MGQTALKKNAKRATTKKASAEAIRRSQYSGPYLQVIINPVVMVTGNQIRNLLKLAGHSVNRFATAVYQTLLCTNLNIVYRR